MADEKIRWRHVRILQCSVQFARDLPGIARFGPGSRPADSCTIVGNGGCEFTDGWLDALPRFQRTTRRSAAAGFKDHRGTALAGDEHAKLVTSNIDVREREPSRIYRQHDRGHADDYRQY